MPSRAERTLRPGRAQVSFTTRGSSVLAAAVAAAIGSFALGETDLLRVAIIIVLVCVGSWLVAWLLPMRVEATQAVHPSDAPVGSVVTVRVSTRVVRPLLPAAVVCHDAASEQLAPTGHLEVVGSRARGGITLAFATSPRSRGAHEVGPLEVTVRDPLGLVTTRRAATGTAAVLGLPRWHEVHPAWLRAGGPLPRFDDTPVDGGVEGEPDVGVREHRPEDGLRRVHWRSSARAGRLMTRLDDPQADRTATIAFDSRADAHTGDSYESTLEIAASLGIALLHAGWNLRLIDSEGERQPFGTRWDAGSLLRFLALSTVATGGALPTLTRADGPAILITPRPPRPGELGRGRTVAVEPSGRRTERRPGITYVAANRVAEALATAPQVEVPA